MHEYEDLEDQDLVGQGDVLEWVGDDRKAPWQCYGVIVTADCDLAHEKHGGMISYVPAMSAQDFLWERWRVERFSSKLEELLCQVGGRIGKWRQKNDQSDAAVSAGAVRKWLDRMTPEALLDEIRVENKGQRNDFLNLLAPVKKLMDCLACDVPNLKILEECYSIINPKAAGNRDMLAKDIQKDWASLPGDLFHLPAVPNISTETGEGLFLHLRHVRQISADLVSARPEDFRSRKAKARRVARVSAPYRYAMTQALGRVFSDIGLPDAHDQRRKMAPHLLFPSKEDIA